MSTPTRSDQLCRITVVAGSSVADVALPSDMPLLDLLPTLIARSGDKRLAEQGAVAQRWGEPPLDDSQTATTAGLHDGDTLFLRPRGEEIPPAEFDDLVDAITSTTGRTADQWRRANTRILIRVIGAIPLLIAGIVVLLPGPAAARQLGIDLTTVLAAAASIAAARAYGDRLTALVSGIAAVSYALLLGVVAGAPPQSNLGPFSVALTPGAALAGGLVAMVLSVLLVVALSDLLEFFVPAALLGMLVAVLGFVSSTTRVSSGAALVIALAVMLMTSVPMMAFRLARLQMPHLPESIEDMTSGIDPLPEGKVTTQIRLADRCIIFFHWGLLVPVALAGVLLMRTPTTSHSILLGLTGALLLLRARLLRGLAQRIPLLCTGGLLVTMVLTRAAMWLPESFAAPAVTVVALMAALSLLGSATWLASQKPAPYWGRGAEIFEWLFGAAVIFTAALVFGVFGWAHGLGTVFGTRHGGGLGL